MTPAPPAPTGGRLLLLALVVITTVTSVVSSLGAPLVPLISRRFEVPLADAQWSLTAAMLTSVVATPLLGRFASGSRRRTALLGTLGLVAVGTVLSSLASVPGSSGPFWLLLLGRALQGLGLGVVPVTLAIARDEFQGARAARALAVLSVTTVVGAGLGYPLTSLLADRAGLAGAYAFGAVLMLATLAVSLATVPGSRTLTTSPVDGLGAALLGLGLVGVLLGISRGEAWGWASAQTLTSTGMGAVLVALFVRRTLHVENPLVDLRLAVRPGLANSNLVALAAGVGMYSLLTMAVIVVQADGWGLGLGVAAAGWVLVPYSLMAVVGARLAHALRGRFGVRHQLALGCLVFGGASALMALRHDQMAAVLLAMAVGGIGSGFTFSSMAVIMAPHLPTSETGSAMALNQVLRSTGFTVGSACAIPLMHVFGGIGDTGFARTLLLLAGVWVAVAAVSSVLDLRTPPPRSLAAG